VNLSDLAKYSMSRSVALSLCDSWAPCYSNCCGVCSCFWDIQCGRMAWPWKQG